MNEINLGKGNADAGLLTKPIPLPPDFSKVVLEGELKMSK